MKRPAYQFYAGDWLRDFALRACSISARGLWIDMLAFMHQAEPYGWLVLNKTPLKTPQLARMVGGSELDVTQWLAELEGAGVFSRTEDGTIYSRRMVRDEEVRLKRARGGEKGAEHGAKGAAYGHLGGRPRKDKAPNNTDDSGDKKPPSNPPPSSSSSSSLKAPSASAEDEVVVEGEPAADVLDPTTGRTYPAAFVEAWALYPRRAGTTNKIGAWEKWQARIKKGYTEKQMTEGAVRYAAFIRASGKENTEHVMMMATFLGPKLHFLEAYAVEPSGKVVTLSGRRVHDNISRDTAFVRDLWEKEQQS